MAALEGGRGPSLPQARNQEAHNRLHSRINDGHSEPDINPRSHSHRDTHSHNHLPNQLQAPAGTAQAGNRRRELVDAGAATNANGITQIVSIVEVEVVDEMGLPVTTYTVSDNDTLFDTTAATATATATASAISASLTGIPSLSAPLEGSDSTEETRDDDTATTMVDPPSSVESPMDDDSSMESSAESFAQSTPTKAIDDIVTETVEATPEAPPEAPSEPSPESPLSQSDMPSSLLPTGGENASESTMPTPTQEQMLSSSSNIPTSDEATSTNAVVAPILVTSPVSDSDSPLDSISTSRKQGSNPADISSSSPLPESEKATTSTHINMLDLTDSTLVSSSTTSTPTSESIESVLSLTRSTTSFTTSTTTSSISGRITSTTAIIGGSGGGGGSSGDESGPNGSNTLDNPDISAAAASSGPGASTSTVVGGVFGGLAAASIFLLLAMFLFRRHKRTHSMAGPDSGSNSDHAPSSTRGILPVPSGGGTSGSGPPAPSAAAMSERSNLASFFVPSALSTLAGSKNASSGKSEGGGSQRSFERVAGRKLPSVLTHGGDGFSDPRESVLSGGSSFYRDSQGFYGGPGTSQPPLAVGSPMRPESGIMVMRNGPARTPITEQNPFTDPVLNPFADPIPENRAHTQNLSPPRPIRDALGRSMPGQDGSRVSRGSGSRFTEEI